MNYKEKSDKWIIMFKILKERKYEPKILYPGKLSLKYKVSCYIARIQKMFSRTFLEKSTRERAPDNQNDYKDTNIRTAGDHLNI